MNSHHYRDQQLDGGGKISFSIFPPSNTSSIVKEQNYSSTTFQSASLIASFVQERTNSSISELDFSINSHESLVTISSSDEFGHFMNNSTQTEYTPYSQRPETYIVPIVFLFIYITGIIGNGTLIYVMLKEKLLRTPSYMFILNLAFGDLLVIIGTVPFVGTIYTFESWPFGLVACKGSEFIRDVSHNVTVLTLCAMSIDR